MPSLTLACFERQTKIERQRERVRETGGKEKKK